MQNNRRLLSLDVLRGLDMLLLTVVGPIFWAANKAWAMPAAVKAQFKHAWGGFTLWDIIMPLFIFMCGAAAPYALSKRLDEDGWASSGFWKHVFGRVALLWFCGMLVQGNLATLDPLKISPFNNTLQAIAVGYLITALVMLIPFRALRVIMPFILAGAYGALLHFLGDYTPKGNMAQIAERQVLSAILPSGSAALKTHGYTWFLTSLMFGAMSLCGAQCAEILRSGHSKKANALVLFIVGGMLWGAGWALELSVPCIKHIYTVSFACQAMGWCVLALALLYVITDVLNVRRGWWLVVLYGQCSLTAYMAMHFFKPALAACTNSIVQGFPRFVDMSYMPLASAVVSAIVLTVVLVIRRRLRGVQPAIEESDEDEASNEHQARNAPSSVPGFKSQLMDGAIASRFQIPGMEGKVPAGKPEAGKSGEASSQASHVKTKLKIH